MSHTRGPWKTLGYELGHKGYLIYDSQDRAVMHLSPGSKILRHEADVNAHLIAAAPELLAALQLVKSDPSRKELLTETMEAVISVVAKAEGRA